MRSISFLSRPGVFLMLACLSWGGAQAGILDYRRLPILPPPAGNESTPARVALGKVLFFDPRLSGSKWISCATCHNPALGWADGLPTGIGHGMQNLARSTPTVLNTAYNKFQFWDGRARSLEEQALGPILNAGEMHRDMGSLLRDLSAIDGYKTMFAAAYREDGVSEAAIGKALAAYERTLITTEAPFDAWVDGDESAITDSAKRGFVLFEGKAKCNLCHQGFNFQDDGFHNLGLKESGKPDPGRYAQRALPAARGAFKTPTLRELSLTAPYMHNGAYATLQQVIDHYNRGGDVRTNLSPNMHPLNLSTTEKSDLIEFLGALNSTNPLTETIPILPQ